MAPPSAQVEITGFDHVDLVVPHRERARHFFVDQLGLEVIGESPEHAYLLFGDQVLGLHTTENGKGFPAVHHIALRVGAWTGLRNRLKRARLVVVAEKERDDSRSIYLKGPDGLSVELVYRPDPHLHVAHRGPALPPPVVEDDDEAEPPAPKKRSRR